MQHIVAAVEILEKWLMRDPNATEWACAMTCCPTVEAKKMDEIRKSVRNYIKLQVKEGNITDFVRRAALATVVFDRANVLCVVKLDKDGGYRRGFGMMWITPEDSTKINARHRATIPSAYVTLLKRSTDDEFSAKMREALEPRRPSDLLRMWNSDVPTL